MMPRERVVVDTNALASRLLLPASLPGQAVRKAVDQAQLLISEATLTELADPDHHTGQLSRTLKLDVGVPDTPLVLVPRYRQPRDHRR